MVLALIAVIGGLALLVWSADWFIAGAAGIARYVGMPPLLIGIVIIGFGTSSPELMISAVSSLQNNPGIALGNAYGSNIANIALILGVTAIIFPIAVRSQVLRSELPILSATCFLAVWQLWDGVITYTEAWVLVAVFTGVMGWSIRQGLQKKPDPLGDEADRELSEHPRTLAQTLFRLTVGLVMLIISSRALVWGAVEIAFSFGVSDLVIGLTIVAIGTSLPELASSLTAARKGNADLVIGNVIGSNLFNTLAVVGLAGVINPIPGGTEVFMRDIPVMTLLTLSLFVLGWVFGRPAGQARISRPAGIFLVTVYAGYTVYLLKSTVLR